MNETPLHDRIRGELDERKDLNLFRTIGKSGAGVGIDLSANSYLALHDNAEIRAEADRLADHCYCGNLASRLIETRSPLYPVLEAELAEWKKTECALIFNSGYTANLGIIQALCTRNTHVFCDRLNHASIIDGILLSGASLSRYAHCDMADLERRIGASSKRERLIVTDSVFSMDGDVAPLADICAIAHRFKCAVMVDEAHATGVFGASCAGYVEECGLEKDVDVVMGTLSKSVAGLGGFFAGSSMLMDCLVNKARSLIYSTALPQSVLAHDIASVRYIRRHPGMGKALLAKAQSFRAEIASLGCDTLNSSTQIVPCMVESDTQAVDLSAYLLSRGIKAPGIRPPTVPAGAARIRFSVHLGCTNGDIAFVASSLNDWKKSHG